MISRRAALKTAPVLALAGCVPGGSGIDMIAIEKAINQVQTAVAQVCSAVPTAESVWLLLTTIMGVSSTNPIMVTAASVEQAIKSITDIACPATNKPTATANINVQGVDVHFIPLKR